MIFENEKKEIKDKLISNSVPKEQAETISDVMATADLYGVTSHGRSTLDAHIERIKRGAYNLNPSFDVIKETDSFALVDGDNSIGFVSAEYCMKYAVKKAEKSGIFTVLARNNNTFGPAFYYPLKAAESGMIGFICSNSPAQMAPIGGKEKMLGTNPFAAVIPVPEREPIIIDMATSVVAKSKLKEYKALNKPIPDGWALDKNGNPTNDAEEGIRGLIQPMAGFKGYAISMLIDIISGVLSGSAYLDKVGRFYSEDKSCMNVGFFMTVISPEIILGKGYSDRIKEFEDMLRNSEPIDGNSVCLPGDDRIEKKRSNGNYEKEDSNI